MANDPIEAMIAKLAPPVADTVRALRALVHRTVPGVTERAQPAWKTINFDYQGGLIAIGGHASWATIGFMRGVELDDPRGKLQGTGKTMRNVRVLPGEPLPRAYLVKLIEQAKTLNHQFGAPEGVGRRWGGGSKSESATPRVKASAPKRKRNTNQGAGPKRRASA